MKKNLIIPLMLFLFVDVHGQNNYANPDVYYNSVDTVESNGRPMISVSVNKLLLKDSILRRYMDLSIKETGSRGFFDDDGSGVFYLISFYGYYRDVNYMHCVVMALRNSFMGHTLYESIRETNIIEAGDTLRIVGCVDYKGFLFVVISREYVKPEDLEILFENSTGKKEIKIYGDYHVDVPYDETDDYFLQTDELSIPFKRKRTERLQKFKY